MHLTHKAGLALALLTVGGSATLPAHADGPNLVTNGGFETGNLTGWDINGNAVAEPASTTSVPHSGSYDAGLVGVFGSISQNISLKPGHTYDLVFYAAANAPNDFAVLWNATRIPGSPQSIPENGTNNPADYTRYEFDGLAPATLGATTLQFTGASFAYVEQLDDISVTDAAPIPEASSVVSLGLLLLLGLGGVIVSRRHKAGAVR